LSLTAPQQDSVIVGHDTVGFSSVLLTLNNSLIQMQTSEEKPVLGDNAELMNRKSSETTESQSEKHGNVKSLKENQDGSTEENFMCEKTSKLNSKPKAELLVIGG
jgi:hypothetical protein